METNFGNVLDTLKNTSFLFYTFKDKITKLWSFFKNVLLHEKTVSETILLTNLIFSVPSRKPVLVFYLKPNIAKTLHLSKLRYDETNQ